MLCPRCKSENLGSSNVCSNCGAPLRATILTPHKKDVRLWIIVGLFIVLAGIFLIYRFVIPGISTQMGKEPSSIQSPTYELTPEFQERLIYAIGKVINQTLLGETISEIDSAVVSGNWIALPICVCLGGNSWIFRSAEGNASVEAQITAGQWTAGDPVGLWQLDQSKEYQSLDLAPWQRGEPIQWYSLNRERSADQITILSPKEAGYFTSISLPQNITEPGVFTQNDRVVGWTFGTWMERGILWNPPQGFLPEPTLSVTEFNGAFSSSWQETQFAKGLAMRDEVQPTVKLEVLAEGFLLDPQFSSEYKPPALRPEAIAREIHSLVSELIKDGFSKEVTDSLSDEFIIKVANPELLKDAALAYVNAYDHMKAVQYFERMKRRLFRSEEQYPADLDIFHAQLYKDWITRSIEERVFYSGWIGFEAGRSLFPGDVELHLLGVDLAVAEEKWERAAELLAMRTYPQRFRDMAQEMESLISERLDAERTIVLRFNPGSTLIPTRAYLNRQVWQDFVIDTGASVTTIPSRTVEALGIRITDRTTVRSVATASGVGLAYEVFLDSIELQDFRVKNVPVIILDMPGHPDVGLLGNDFLKHFDVEINNENGILKLHPRN